MDSIKIEYSIHQVYLIQNLEIDNRFKIGFSKHVNKRFQNILSQSGCKMKLCFVSENLLNAPFIEAKVHEILSEYRYIGEWFNIDEHVAINTILETIQKSGNPYNEATVRKTIVKIKKPNLPKPSSSQYKVYDGINLNKYKRIRPGIYSDSSGELFNIKYRINDKKWMVAKLTRL